MFSFFVFQASLSHYFWFYEWSLAEDLYHAMNEVNERLSIRFSEFRRNHYEREAQILNLLKTPERQHEEDSND